MDLEVDRQQLSTVRLVEAPPGRLRPGQARLRAHQFALTSNNITYAVFGDMMNYWDFFPANSATDEIVWGRVPGWGCGDIVESTVGDLAEDTRVHGYLPMSDELIIEPGRFDDGLGCYHQVVTYDSLAELPVGPAVYVDFAGDSAVTRAVHEHFQDQLTYSMIVGGTHWDGPPPEPGDLPGPAPQFFFAPAQIAKRNGDWGRDGLEQRTIGAWTSYREWVDGWLRFERTHGADAVKTLYLELLSGRVDPRVGHVCAMAAE